MEDRFLVFQCKRGCRKSFARIYEKYKHDLVRLAVALLNDAGAAEDVVHDVFVQFAQGLEGFRLTGSLKGYLMTCVANRARNCNRAQRAGVRASIGSIGCREVSPSPVERIECSEQMLRLADALEKLSYDQREVTALHLYGQMSFRAIGKRLKIPVSTTKSRYQHGLITLRRLVDREVDV
ncbi:MAG: RNA polymerase sigma factor [Planctomycetota bacterium]|jgi:RNA polymerase sigma-70 factor (ECF subfamily)